MTTPRHTPEDWYWIVAGSTTQVYSSKVGDFVPVTDAAYQAWLLRGVPATKIDTEVHLGEVLAVHFLRPIPPVMLDAYKEAQSRTYTPLDVTPKVIHFVYNEVRELQGKAPLTFEQFRQAIKDKM